MVRYINMFFKAGDLIARKELVMLINSKYPQCANIIDTYRTYLTQAKYIDFTPTRGVYVILKRPSVELTIEESWNETKALGTKPYVLPGS